MRRFQRYFASIRNRLLLILTLVPLLILSLFVYGTYTNASYIIENQVNESYLLALDARAALMDEFLRSAYEISVEVTYDGSAISDQLDTMLLTNNVTQRATLKRYIEKTLTALEFNSQSVGLIALIDLTTGETVVSADVMRSANIERQLEPLCTYRRATVHRPHATLSGFRGGSVISLSRPFETQMHDHSFTLYIESSNRFLGELLAPAYDEMESEIYIDKALLDGDGVVLYASNESVTPPGDTMEAIEHAGMLKDVHLLLYEGDGWSIAGLVRESYYRDIYMPLLAQAIFRMAVCTALFALLALSIWRTVYNPIRDFAAELREMKPSTLYAPGAKAAELDEFRAQFQHMRGDILRLVQQTEASAKKSAALETELLLSRINPHFLHNTLDNIKWLARENGQDEVADMLTTLNGLIYYNLGKQRFTTLGGELKAVEDYLLLQRRIRPFEYALNVGASAAALEMTLPCYTLQPIVENALRHGYRDGLKLSIVVTEVGNRVYVKVRDNGLGMDADSLARVRASLTDKADETGIGIRYVRRALMLMYGSGVRVDVESALGEGTSFTISVERSDNA